MRRLSAEPVPAAGADGVGPPAGTTVAAGVRLLHPGFLFAAVWALGLGGWLLASPDWFLEVAAAEKHVSARAVLYFTLCVAAYLIGAVVGPPLLRADVRPAVVRLDGLSQDEAGTFRRNTYRWFAVGAACAVYLLAAGTLRFGGPSALISFVSGGGSLEQLAEEYFEPAKKTGMTVWIHALVAVGPLTTVAAALTTDRSKVRRLAAVNVAGLALVFLVSLAFAERLITFGYIVASLVAWVGVRPWSRGAGPGRPARGTAVRILLVAALVAALWVGGEFSRTYLSTRQAETPISMGDVTGSLPLAAERFLAYVATSVNNGMFAVDNAEERGLILNTGSVFVTTVGFERPGAPLVGAAAAETDAMLWEIFPYHTPLTTFSMPGDVFQDVGWVGPALIFWFGALSACVYVRFRRGELWALLVYPVVVAGILDSYRILYWTRTEMLLPAIVMALVCMGLYRKGRRGSLSPQSTPISAR